MSSSWQAMPAPTRAMVSAVGDAVAGAQSGDPSSFEEATSRLSALDPESIRTVLGDVVRLLLEDVHPDGIDAEGVQAVISRCARSSRAWMPIGIAVDVPVLVAVLAGTLGVHDLEEEPRPGSALDVARHATLLIAELLAGAGRPLCVYLDAALAEMLRRETIEMP